MSAMDHYDNKIVMISGAAGGLGAALVRRLLPNAYARTMKRRVGHEFGL